MKVKIFEIHKTSSYDEYDQLVYIITHSKDITDWEEVSQAEFELLKAWAYNQQRSYGRFYIIVSEPQIDIKKKIAELVELAKREEKAKERIKKKYQAIAEKRQKNMKLKKDKEEKKMFETLKNKFEK